MLFALETLAQVSPDAMTAHQVQSSMVSGDAVVGGGSSHCCAKAVDTRAALNTRDKIMLCSREVISYSRR